MAYLPTEWTIKTPGAFEEKLIFDNDQMKIASTKSLFVCGPLSDWLRKKRSIYALHGIEERVDR